MAPRRSAPPASPLDEAQRNRLVQMEGVAEDTWLEVIQKMDEVYSQLVRDEIALEEKNAQLEQSQQFIFSLLSAMSDVLIACNEQGGIEETNAALCELVGRSETQLRDSLAATRFVLTPDQVARLDTVSDRTPAYPYWHQRMIYGERNPPPV